MFGRDGRVQLYLFQLNQPNYLHPCLCSEWAWLKMEVGGEIKRCYLITPEINRSSSWIAMFRKLFTEQLRINLQIVFDHKYKGSIQYSDCLFFQFRFFHILVTPHYVFRKIWGQTSFVARFSVLDFYTKWSTMLFMWCVCVRWWAHVHAVKIPIGFVAVQCKSIMFNTRTAVRSFWPLLPFVTLNHKKWRMTWDRRQVQSPFNQKSGWFTEGQNSQVEVSKT